MKSLETLEANLQLLITRYEDLRQDYIRLQETSERQREEIMQTHAELVSLQQQYRHLEQAHAISVTPENRERAYQQISSLIQRVDRAIEILKQ